MTDNTMREGKLWAFLHDSIHEAYKKLSTTGTRTEYHAMLDSIAAKVADDVDARFLQAAQSVPVGMKVSVDVGTGEHDSFNRVFATVTGQQEDGQGGVILLCEEESRNFGQSVPVVGEPPENAAKSTASMVEEWVQECIKKNGNWQERLPTLIQSRLKRFWPAHSIPATELERLRKDAERYRKLRGWMSSNVKEGWGRVTDLSAVFCYVSWQEGDSYLDNLPECNVGLMQKDAAIAQEPRHD